MRIWWKNGKALAKAVVLLLAFALPWFLYGLSCMEQGAVATDGAAEIRQSQAPESTQKLIALTFDDGPSSVTTPVLLDGLAQRGVHATFFLVGTMAENNPGVVRRMAEEGHQIALHTYDHEAEKGLSGLTRAQFSAQVDTTRALLTKLTGQTEFVLRPPYGSVDANLCKWADCPIILWSIDPEDWKRPNTEREVAHILSKAQDGSIILLHDIFRPSVETALQVIDALHAEGYYFVTVDELFAARGIPLENGVIYGNAYP